MLLTAMADGRWQHSGAQLHAVCYCDDIVQTMAIPAPEAGPDKMVTSNYRMSAQESFMVLDDGCSTNFMLTL